MRRTAFGQVLQSRFVRAGVMDDVTAESAGANHQINRTVRMSPASAGRLRLAPLVVGGLLLLLAVTWERELVSGSLEDPPEYRRGGVQAGSQSDAEPEIEIIPRRLTAPVVDNRPPVRYRKAEPPLAPPAKAVPSRAAPTLREHLPEMSAPTQPESPLRRGAPDSSESAEPLVRPSPTTERAEPLVLHRSRRGVSSGPGSPHGDIAVPLILGSEDRVPEGVPEDFEEVLPESDDPLPQEVPGTIPVTEKPPVVVREEMPFWDPRFAVPAAPAVPAAIAPAAPGSPVHAVTPGVPAPLSAGTELIHSAPVVGMGNADSRVAEWSARSKSGAESTPFPESAVAQQPAVQPPQWPGSSTPGSTGTAGIPGPAANVGIPVQPYAEWPTGTAGHVYGTIPYGTASGWQPSMPQQAPAYQLPVRPDSYRSITSGGMSAGGMGGGGRYGQPAGTGRQTAAPTPPGSRYGSLPSAQATVYAPPPAVSRYGSGVRTGMGYAARPAVPQPQSQYLQMGVPNSAGMPPQAPSRYGATAAMGGMVNSARPYSAAPPQISQMQTTGVNAGRVPGVSTAARSRPMPGGTERGVGIPVGAAPASSSRYGVPAGSLPGAARR